MPKITTFLTYDRQAEDAAKFYTSIFPNSKITRISRYGEGTPMPKGSVMVVDFDLDGRPFIALNGGPHFKFSDAISLSVECNTQEEIDKYWNKLSDGGQQIECGWVRDRFGVSWQVNPKILSDMLSDKDPKKAQRVMDAMMKMKKIVIADLKKAYDSAA
ncbi:MAG TPA: VOC family protein [Vicinamibacterales bacterium]|nr:VOC family protein [Vicinamibacterales bacterium]